MNGRLPINGVIRLEPRMLVHMWLFINFPPHPRAWTPKTPKWWLNLKRLYWRASVQPKKYCSSIIIFVDAVFNNDQVKSSISFPSDFLFLVGFCIAEAVFDYNWEVQEYRDKLESPKCNARSYLEAASVNRNVYNFLG